MSEETMASLRRRLTSPAAPPLENDDLLAEILLRLPPLPSSLPRASAVSRRWRGLASDPRFCSRFRAHHRRDPPLLGHFIKYGNNTRFQPALEAPNCVPQGRFSFPIDADSHFRYLGSRHGLVLSFLGSREQLLVWDPFIGDHHRLDIPPAGFDTEENLVIAAVLRTVGDAQHFQVVLVGTSDMQYTQVVASVYSSETSLWGNLITLPVPRMYVYPHMPAVMIGDSLYWLLHGNSFGILEFDVGRQSLNVIPMPGEEIIPDDMDLGDIWVIMADGGGLGFLLLSGFDVQLWKRKTDCDGVASWALQRTIALDRLLSINSEKEKSCPGILGYAENNNVVLLWTSIGVFTVHLESLQFKKPFEIKDWESYYPFEVVYTADKGIDGGDDGAELLQNK